MKKQPFAWLSQCLDPFAGLTETLVMDLAEGAPLSRWELQMRQMLLDPAICRLIRRYQFAPESLYEGTQRSLRRGEGLEFHQLHPYVPGDEVRKLDWSVYARTLSLQVRSYQTEHSALIWLVLDWSPSMFQNTLLFEASEKDPLKDPLAVKTFWYWGNWIQCCQALGHRVGVCCLHGDGQVTLLDPTRSPVLLEKLFSVFRKAVCKQFITPEDNNPIAACRGFPATCSQVLSGLLKTASQVSVWSDFEWDWTALQTLSLPLSKRQRLKFVLCQPSVQAHAPLAAQIPLSDVETGFQFVWDTQDRKLTDAVVQAAEQTLERLKAGLAPLGQVIPLEGSSLQSLFARLAAS